MALFSKRNIKNDFPFGLTLDDLKGGIEDFPMGIVVRMLEEQKNQGNRPNAKVFQIDICMDSYRGGFDWDNTESGYNFWSAILIVKDFKKFFKVYPDYEMYNLN